MRIGLFGILPGVPGAAGDAPLDELIGRVERAEAAGFAAFWAAGNANLDTLLTLTLTGRSTSRIELGTAVIVSYPIHPVVLARQALTAQAATGNRFTLGIGLGHRLYVEDQLGLDYAKPVRHTREYLATLTALVAGEAAAVQGEEFRVTTQLSVPEASRPPVLVAALGPQMLKVAGSLADGTITWMGTAKYLEETAIPIISKAAEAAGRSAPRVAAGFPIVLTNRTEAAEAAVRQVFARYERLPSYRATLDRGGAVDPAGAAIVGDEAAIERQLRHLAGLGVTDLLAAPFAVAADPDAYRRTYEFLAGLARAAG